jgi:2-polyprenyl-6-methoxyphenol hydroxylase-like FAD-dependent oxidoreductase
MMVNSYDVAVVGYGPGAQTLAALLARKCQRVVVFERYPQLYNLPRAGHIDHEAVRMVQSVGDAESLVETMWEVREEYVWVNAQGQRLMLQPAHAPTEAVSGWFSDYTLWQPHLESALDSGARAAGAEVNFGWEAVGLQQDETGVLLTVARTEQATGSTLRRTEDYRQLRASYVVGADGASSFVRTTLGISREDLGFNERWLDVDLRTLRPVKFKINLGQICDPARPRLVMPMGKSHRRFEWMLHPDETIEQMERPETAWALLEEFGVTPETHEIARDLVYTFQARIARRWRVGRVFISGDAAHTMPPFAGQGALSSMRDSNNLAWKLSAVLRGLASDSILDTYQLERHPHVRAWTEISLAEGRVSCELDPAKAAERDRRLLSGEKLPHPEPPILTCGIVDSSPLAGTLGLQARVRSNEGAGRFDDVLGPSRFSLITMGGEATSVLSEAQRSRLEALGAIVTEILPASASPGPGTVVDADGKYQQYFSTHGIAAILNRPDFYVFGTVANLAQLPSLVDRLESHLRRQ